MKPYEPIGFFNFIFFKFLYQIRHLKYLDFFIN